MKEKLKKVFYTLTLISILAIGVGGVIEIWFDATIGFKVFLTAVVSTVTFSAICMSLNF